MNDAAKITRVIRMYTVGGVVMLAGVALALLLVGVGELSWDAPMALSLGFGAATGSLWVLTAVGLRRDRDDPAGIERRERRLLAATVVWGAGLLLAALLAVVGIIVWGLLR